MSFNPIRSEISAILSVPFLHSSNSPVLLPQYPLPSSLSDDCAPPVSETCSSSSVKLFSAGQAQTHTPDDVMHDNDLDFENATKADPK
jgi:hypothetical protein